MSGAFSDDQPWESSQPAQPLAPAFADELAAMLRRAGASGQRAFDDRIATEAGPPDDLDAAPNPVVPFVQDGRDESTAFPSKADRNGQGTLRAPRTPAPSYGGSAKGFYDEIMNAIRGAPEAGAEALKGAVDAVGSVVIPEAEKVAAPAVETLKRAVDPSAPTGERVMATARGAEQAAMGIASYPFNKGIEAASAIPGVGDLVKGAADIPSKVTGAIAHKIRATWPEVFDPTTPGGRIRIDALGIGEDVGTVALWHKASVIAKNYIGGPAPVVDPEIAKQDALGKGYEFDRAQERLANAHADANQGGAPTPPIEPPAPPSAPAPTFTPPPSTEIIPPTNPVPQEAPAAPPGVVPLPGTAPIRDRAAFEDALAQARRSPEEIQAAEAARQEGINAEHQQAIADAATEDALRRAKQKRATYDNPIIGGMGEPDNGGMGRGVVDPRTGMAARVGGTIELPPGYEAEQAAAELAEKRSQAMAIGGRDLADALHPLAPAEPSNPRVPEVVETRRPAPVPSSDELQASEATRAAEARPEPEAPNPVAPPSEAPAPTSRDKIIANHINAEGLDLPIPGAERDGITTQAAHEYVRDVARRNPDMLDTRAYDAAEKAASADRGNPTKRAAMSAAWEDVQDQIQKVRERAKAEAINEDSRRVAEEARAAKAKAKADAAPANPVMPPVEVKPTPAEVGRASVPVEVKPVTNPLVPGTPKAAPPNPTPWGNAIFDLNPIYDSEGKRYFYHVEDIPRDQIEIAKSGPLQARNFDEARVKEIARNFDPGQFRPDGSSPTIGASVAWKNPETGKYNILAGNHRMGGAMLAYPDAKSFPLRVLDNVDQKSAERFAANSQQSTSAAQSLVERARGATRGLGVTLEDLPRTIGREPITADTVDKFTSRNPQFAKKVLGETGTTGNAEADAKKIREAIVGLLPASIHSVLEAVGEKNEAAIAASAPGIIDLHRRALAGEVHPEYDLLPLMERAGAALDKFAGQGLPKREVLQRLNQPSLPGMPDPARAMKPPDVAMLMGLLSMEGRENPSGAMAEAVGRVRAMALADNPKQLGMFGAEAIKPDPMTIMREAFGKQIASEASKFRADYHAPRSGESGSAHVALAGMTAGGLAGFTATGGHPLGAVAGAAIGGALGSGKGLPFLGELQRAWQGRVAKPIMDWTGFSEESRPHVLKWDKDQAELQSERTNAPSFRAALGESNLKRILEPLEDGAPKVPTLPGAARDAAQAARAKYLLERENLAAIMADATSRKHLHDTDPDEFDRAAADPAIRETLARYKIAADELSAVRKSNGGTVISDDYLARRYDEHMLADANASPEARTLYDKIVRPRKLNNSSREASAEFFAEHGRHEFGPAYLQKYVSTHLADVDNRTIADFTKKATEANQIDPATGKPMPPPHSIMYNGHEFFGPDTPEAKAGKPTYATYDPTDHKWMTQSAAKAKAALDVSTRARELAQETWDQVSTQANHLDLEDAKAKEADASRALDAAQIPKKKLLGPKAIVDEFNNWGKAKDPKTGLDKALQFNQRLNQTQVMATGGGVRHVENLTRRLMQLRPGGALNPKAWFDAADALFGGDLRREAQAGLADPRAQGLAKYGAYTDGASAKYQEWPGGAVNPLNWGHRLLRDPNAVLGFGGVDQRMRLKAAKVLSELNPNATESEVAQLVRTTTGDYNRRNWSDKQKTLGNFMFWSGWAMPGLRQIARHPVNTTIVPLAIAYLMNKAIHAAKGNRYEDAEDTDVGHVGDRNVHGALAREPVGDSLAHLVTDPARALMDGKGFAGAADALWGGVKKAASGVGHELRPEIGWIDGLRTGKDSQGGDIVPARDRGKPGQAAKDGAAYTARTLVPEIGSLVDARGKFDPAGFVGTQLGFSSYPNGPEERLRRNAGQAATVAQTLANLRATRPDADGNAYETDRNNAVFLENHKDLSGLTKKLTELDNERQKIQSSAWTDAEKANAVKNLAAERAGVLNEADRLNDRIYAKRHTAPTPPKATNPLVPRP